MVIIMGISRSSGVTDVIIIMLINRKTGFLIYTIIWEFLQSFRVIIMRS